MTTGQKSKLKIHLKRTLKAAQEARQYETELAKTTEEIFGYNWSDVDADGIIDSIGGFDTGNLTVDEFIHEMETAIKRRRE